MKILIDIGHPAHVHYFKNFINILEKKGHYFQIIAKNRNITYTLLEKYGIKYIKRGNYPKSLFLKALKIIFTDMLVIWQSIKFKPDILLGFSGTHVSHAGWILRIPSIVIDDTDNAKFAHLTYKYFASTILTPECFPKIFGRKQILFNSYMELCYLHHNYFKPDKAVLKKLGVKQNEKYFILRFVSWAANHDNGSKGISHQNKLQLVNRLSEYGRVFITAETQLPNDLEIYKVSLDPNEMHDAISFSSLLFGESATMASEAAVLGIPAIFIDRSGRCYTKEQEEKFGLVFNFSESENDQLNAIDLAISIVKDENLKKNKWQKRRQELLNSKIDLTEFLVWFTENYPKSVQILKENPDYQYNFK